jgi:hypothetical protein
MAIDYSVSVDNNPLMHDPVIKRLTKAYKETTAERDRLTADYAKSMGLTIGGHEWVQPKDPKVRKSLKDAMDKANAAREELRLAFKERGIDVDAQVRADRANDDARRQAYREKEKAALRKMGLGETLERLEAPKTSMVEMIDRLQRQRAI